MISIIRARIELDCTKGDEQKLNDGRLKDKEKTQLKNNVKLSGSVIPMDILLQHDENTECCRTRKKLPKK